MSPSLPPNAADTMEHDEGGNDDRNPDQAGWDAIDRALAPLYGEQEPRHYGTLIKHALGGPDPLDGISAYKREQPVPHWHFVSYGLSELYAKESEDPERSGWGFELTFRLRDDSDASEPPVWALNFLQNLARYVVGSGNAFADGHYLNANGPIAADSDTRIRSVAFVRDPELGEIDSPHGKLEFLQVVGLTNEEELALKRWSTRKVLQAFEPHMPLWITDLERDSLMQESEIAAEIAAGTASDGSDTGFVFVDGLSWQQQARRWRKPLTTVVLGARQVGELLALLPLRLPFAKPFALVGAECRIEFEHARRNAATADGADLRLSLTADTLRELVANLQAREGQYPLRSFDLLSFLVRKTQIKDAEGRVVQTIG
ncbi:suppressor of fused domain protein [Lysobacter sp. Root983]|uniref:suppressor of fused domain protein n=1 Tax=Lysobacter sp. Root983 TaxID=1736613 RepID=UPI001F2C411E|nr:suppressor of fused domain protein [Lysobacter sp. Root983]